MGDIHRGMGMVRRLSKKALSESRNCWRNGVRANGDCAADEDDDDVAALSETKAVDCCRRGGGVVVDWNRLVL